MKIAVASGKGGTGKTTVAVNLFSVIQNQEERNYVLADCDVEEPNAHVFLNGEHEWSENVTTPIPSIDKDKCVYCGKCAEICAFNAIMFVKPISHIQVLPDLCKSCGACTWACPYDAINEIPKKLGVLNQYKLDKNNLLEGMLDIGSPFSVPVIKELKKKAEDYELVIYDSPPGTSCPVMETIHDVDFVVVVAEPTPFGVADLKLMIETLKQMDKQAGVVINRSTSDNHLIYEYLEQENLPVMMEIPFERQLAEQYSNGLLFAEQSDIYREKFENLFDSIHQKITGKPFSFR
ncbi:MAG: ATP-binding protein [Bacteroidota bacterium]